LHLGKLLFIDLIANVLVGTKGGREVLESVHLPI